MTCLLSMRKRYIGCIGRLLMDTEWVVDRCGNTFSAKMTLNVVTVLTT